MPSRSDRRHPILLPVAVCLTLVGCEIREEQVRASQSGRLRWPDPVTRRLESDGAPAAAAAGGTIAFVESCDAGRRLADAAGKPLLIIFRAAWCRWSAAFTQQTLGDPGIVSLSEQFICVQIDADRNADVCRQYGVTQFPTVLILAPDNREVSRHSGHTLAADLQPLLHQALAAERLAGTRPPQATPAAAVAPEASSTAPDQPVQTADAPTGEISR